MRHAAVLDIGSSKVVCMHASRSSDGRLSVGGADIRSFSGYAHSSLADEQDLVDTIVLCVETTMQKCGYRFRNIAITVPAPFCKIFVGSSALAFEEKPKRITDAEIDMLRKASLPEEPPQGYSLMHSTPFTYVFNGVKRDDVPPDVAPDSLEATFSHCYANDAFLEVVYEALNKLGMSSICVSSALATATTMIPPQERKKTAIMLDVGYTHTDVCLVEQSAITAQSTIDVGGRHFASDLSQVLKVDLAVAELAKRRYVFGLDYQDSTELMRTPDGTRSVEWSFIQTILEERMHELCELVGEEIHKLLGQRRISPTVFLSGGGIALMRGSREYLERVLMLKTKRDMPWMPRMNTPNYASAFGAVNFVLDMNYDDLLSKQVEVGMFRRLMDFFVK